jgi:hypothetical protein
MVPILSIPRDVDSKFFRWKFIGRTVREDPQALERHVLNWNAQGRRKRGIPKKTWRTIEEKITKVGETWKGVGALAENRMRWR